MSSRRNTAVLAVLIALFAAGGACNGQTAGTGSETNWILGCTSDSDCAQGHCTCGMCTPTCASSDECPGGDGATCVGAGATTFSAVCGDTIDPAKGLCLARCRSDAFCPGGYRCMEGACVPATDVSLDVGAPCVSTQENLADYGGASETEVIVDSGFPSCATGVCLTAYFRGRVTCPYGQPADPANPAQVDPAHQSCFTPDGLPVTVPVEPQLSQRRPIDAVYCSCRCDGDGPGPFCACPSGFDCVHLVPEFSGTTLAGSYCMKAGTEVADPAQLATIAGPSCSETLHNCDTQGP